MLRQIKNCWWRFTYWIGYKPWQDSYMGRCRVCNSGKDVICFDARGIWAYPIRNTYCPEHCPDHDYNRHSDGTYCDTCGKEPDQDDYEDFYGNYY